jgi:hypothetical protein
VRKGIFRLPTGVIRFNQASRNKKVSGLLDESNKETPQGEERDILS